MSRRPMAGFDIAAAGGALTTDVRSRVRNWARASQIKGLEPRLPVMATPPTITKSTGNVSSVNGAYINNNVQYNGQNAAPTWLGGLFDPVTDLGIATRKAVQVTRADASKSGTGPVRVRFQTDAQQIDCSFVEVMGGQFNVIVDGHYAGRTSPFGWADSGQVRWAKIDFGADAITYGLNGTIYQAITGGSGHAVNDIITLDGGAGAAAGTPATVRVAAVSGGAVLRVTADGQRGAYTTLPTSPLSQVSSSGSGTGLTIGVSPMSKNYTTRRLRNIEIVFDGPARFLGLVLSAGATLKPYGAPASQPRIVFVGDSHTSGTYMEYGGAHMASSIAQHLGLYDRHVISANGGTGWNQNNTGATPNTLRWSSSERIADVVALAPDICVFTGSQNDAQGALLEAAITATLIALQSALPDTLFVGIGNVLGDSTALANSIQEGWSGTGIDVSRTRFINNHNPIKWIPTAGLSAWQAAGDTNHMHQQAYDWWAQMAAEAIREAVLDMAL